MISLPGSHPERQQGRRARPEQASRRRRWPWSSGSSPATRSRLPTPAPRARAYCATNAAEALLYGTLAASKKAASVVFPTTLCEALFLKAYALNEMKRETDGVATLEELTALAPLHAHYFVELGYGYRMIGAPDKAMVAYRAALDNSKAPGLDDAKADRAAALRGIGYLLIDKNDLDGAADSIASRSRKIKQRDRQIELDYIPTACGRRADRSIARKSGNRFSFQRMRTPIQSRPALSAAPPASRQSTTSSSELAATSFSAPTPPKLSEPAPKIRIGIASGRTSRPARAPLPLSPPSARLRARQARQDRVFRARARPPRRGSSGCRA